MSDKDTIYRQDAINAADRADYTGLAIEDVKKVTDEVVKELKQLPSAQPKHGKWVYHSNPTIGINPEDAYCSCCGFHVDTTGNIDFDEYNFCPHCGADMRGNEDGTD